MDGPINARAEYGTYTAAVAGPTKTYIYKNNLENEKQKQKNVTYKQKYFKKV